MKRALCFLLLMALFPLYALAETADAPAVYMTSRITPEGLMAVYEALGREAQGENVAVKISTGETAATICGPSSSENLYKPLAAPSWSATPPMAVSAPPRPCTISWLRITAIRPSRMWTSWTKMAP